MLCVAEAITLSSSGDVSFAPTTGRGIYILLGGTAVFTADDSSKQVTIDTSDISGTSTVKGKNAELTATDHAYISAGDPSSGNSGDVTISQVFYGLSETRALFDTTGAVFISPEPDMGMNLFTTSSFVSGTPNAMYAVAGSNAASGLLVISGVNREVVDVTLSSYRGCLVEVLIEIVFSDTVVLGKVEYFLHQGGTAKVSGTASTSMSNAYISEGATLTFTTRYSSNVWTISAEYTAAGLAETTGKAYTLVQLKGGYASYSIYNS